MQTIQYFLCMFVVLFETTCTIPASPLETNCSIPTSLPILPIRLEGESFAVRGNTLYSKFDSCTTTPNNIDFIDVEGVKISKDYLIIKGELNLQLNNDSLTDKLLVLSPVIQEEDSFKSECYYTHSNKRLLLVLLRDSTTKQLNISSVNEHAILNRDEAQSEPFRFLEHKEEHSFSVKHYIGSSLRCYFDAFFKSQEDGIYLYKTYQMCYSIHDSANMQEKIQEYKINDSTKLEAIDIRKLIEF